MIAHITHPQYLKDIFARQTAKAIENMQLYHQAVGDKIVAILVSGTDFGTQRGEFISPDLYRDIYQPFHKQMNDWIHTHTGWKAFYHCCGSVYHLISSFIEAGVDILNPVQCSAANMEPERLKQEFGDRLVLWGGGVDTQHTLPFGSPDDVSRLRLQRHTQYPGQDPRRKPDGDVRRRSPTRPLSHRRRIDGRAKLLRSPKGMRWKTSLAFRPDNTP